MSKPKLNLDIDHISDFLNEPNNQSSTPSASSLMPQLPCRITVTLDDVVAYDRNPRRSKNPNYESIKESIRHRGLDDEPTITRRSIDEPFMIRSGGNTRLTILNELYREYLELAQTAENDNQLDEAKKLRLKAEEYYRFEWNYKPWESESSALIGHMAENEERGDMIYVEKALAIKELQDIFNKNEKKPLSARKLSEKITQSGWTISHTAVSLMNYVNTELEPYLSKALWSGMGSAPISKIRTIHRAYIKFCERQKISAEKFKTLWHETLTTCDDDELDINNSLRRYADQLIADEIHVDYFTVTAEINAILLGNKKVIRETPLDPAEQATEHNENVVNIKSVSADTQTHDHTGSNTKDSQQISTSNNQEHPSSEVCEDDIKALQEHIYISVASISVDFDLADYISRSTNGFGFIIKPYEDDETPASINIENNADAIHRNALWLHFKQLSLQDLFSVTEYPIPANIATSGSHLTTDTFFTLNSHFHMMRLTDKKLQNELNKIDRAIADLLHMASQLYTEQALSQLFNSKAQ